MKTFIAKFPYGVKQRMKFDDDADLSVLKNQTYALHTYTGNVRPAVRGVVPSLRTSIMAHAYGPQWAHARRIPTASVYDFRKKSYVMTKRNKVAQEKTA